MLSNHPNCLGGNGPSASSDLIGDVDGPASATDNAVARFDGTTGKLIQNSVVTIADSTGAIAGAQSLTSPASTNLTLGTTSFGTALTVVSSNGQVGIGTTTPSDRFVVSNAGAAGLEFGVTTSVINQAYNRSGSAYVDYQDNCLNRIFCTGGTIAALTLSSTQAATFAGAATISSTTAGSSGAGALVVQGGISAGNTGSAASYFGGAVTTNGAGSTNYGSTNSTLILNRASASAGNFVRFQGTTAYDTYIGTIGTAAGIAPTADTFVIGRDGIAPTFALVPSTGAATFAGAVTAMIAGTRSSVSDDSVASFTPLAINGVTRGFFIILNPDYNESIIGGYLSSGGSYYLYSIVKSANVTLTNSTTMTGTTGTDGKMNIGFNNGIIYIENRLGGTGNFLYQPFGGTD